MQKWHDFGDAIYREIIIELERHFKTKIVAGETLVFFDEIQECPRVGFKMSEKNIAENACEKTVTYNIPMYLAWNIDMIKKRLFCNPSINDRLQKHVSYKGTIYEIICLESDLWKTFASISMRIILII